MQSKPIRRTLSRGLLYIAYVSCVLQWLWMLVLGLPLLIDSGAIDMLSSPPPLKPVAPPEPTAVSPIIWITASILTVIILVVTVVVVIRLPRSLAHTGERVVMATTKVVLPVITHHQPLPAKKRKALSRWVMLLVRLSLVVTPMVVSLLLPPPDGLTRLIIAIIAGVLALTSAVLFVASWLLEPASTSRTQSHASRG